MDIRAEQPQDTTAIGEVVTAAFGQADEARLVEEIRADGDIAASLVAVLDGKVIGHVLLSKMQAPFSAMALAPLAVHPAYQGQRVGGTLMRTAIARARLLGAEAIFVQGDPAYYSRFGFKVEAASGFTSPYAGPHLMVLVMGGALPVSEGEISHAPAFSRL